MIEVAVMIEGQDGLNWSRWQRIAQTVEDLGFAGLFRSDHFTNSSPPDKDSLECWVSLTWLASHTRRIQFGPLVSPVSFRHPVFLARMAAAVDDLSGGRLMLGMGAGWQEREHKNFGFNLLTTDERFTRFEEGLKVASQLLRGESAVNFSGKYYQLEGAQLLPRPSRPGGLSILIGGNGQERTLPLAARYASEWNGVYLTPQEYLKRSTRLDELLREQGRDPHEVRRSLMTGIVYGRNLADVEAKVARRTDGKRLPEEVRQQGVIVGTATEIIDQMGHLAEAGVQRVMLQWLDLDDTAGLEALAKGIL